MLLKDGHPTVTGCYKKASPKLESFTESNLNTNFQLFQFDICCNKFPYTFK